MTIIVSVKINDGIVMATDSASTFPNGQVYLHANKMINIVKGIPIGAMVTGDGGIGNESIGTLLKDLRKRLSDTADPWYLNPCTYTVEAAANYVREFLFVQKSRAAGSTTQMQIRICGYSAGRPLPEVWDLYLDAQNCAAPNMVQGEEDAGILWSGEYEALDRLVLGRGNAIIAVAIRNGMTAAQAQALDQMLIRELGMALFIASMPTQDAIELARFLVQTTIAFVRFSVPKQPKTVGGAIEVAAITKHEGFRWVDRKLFYPAVLN